LKVSFSEWLIGSRAPDLGRIRRSGPVATATGGQRVNRRRPSRRPIGL